MWFVCCGWVILRVLFHVLIYLPAVFKLASLKRKLFPLCWWSNPNDRQNDLYHTTRHHPKHANYVINSLCPNDVMWRHSTGTTWASCQIHKIAGTHASGIPRHRRWAIPTCITARASRTCRDACLDGQLAVSFEIGGGGNVPGILGACTTCNFTYLVRGPLTQVTAPSHQLKKCWLILTDWSVRSTDIHQMTISPECLALLMNTSCPIEYARRFILLRFLSDGTKPLHWNIVDLSSRMLLHLPEKNYKRCLWTSSATCS